MAPFDFFGAIAEADRLATTAPADALARYEQVLAAVGPRLAPGDRAAVGVRVATALRRLGRHGAAIEAYDEAVAVLESVAPGTSQLAGAYNGRAITWQEAGQLDRADADFTRALAVEDTIDPDHPRVVGLLTNLATVRLRRGDPESAVPLAERAARVLGEGDGPTAIAVHDILGWAYYEVGRFPEAGRCLQRTLPYLLANAPRIIETADALERFCAICVRLQPPDGASATLDGIVAKFDPEAAGTRTSGVLMFWSGVAYARQERYDAAAERFGAAVRLFAEHPDRAERRWQAMLNQSMALSEAALARDDLDGAVTHAVDGCERLRAEGRGGHEEGLAAARQAAEVQVRAGQPDRALAIIDAALAAVVDPAIEDRMVQYGAELAAKLHRPARSAQLWERLAAIRTERAPGSRALVVALDNCAVQRRALGDVDGAREWGRRALEVSRLVPDGHLDTAICLSNLAVTAFAAGELAEAAAWLDEEHALLAEHAPESAEMVVCLSSIGSVRNARGDRWSASLPFGQAASLARRIGARTSAAAMAYANEASQDIDVDQVTDDTVAALREALSIQREHGQLAEIVNVGHLLVAALSMLDRPGEAVETAHELVDLCAAAVPGSPMHAEAQANLAIALLGRDGLDSARALALLDEAIAVLVPTGDRSLTVHLRTARARAFRRVGRVDDAIEDLRAAIDDAEWLRLGVGVGPQYREVTFAKLQAPYQMLVELLVERDDTDLAFQYAERSRARSLLEQARTAGVAPPEPGSRAEALQREIRALQARLDLAAAARSLPIETAVAHFGEAAGDELQARVNEYVGLLASGPELEDRLERLRLELAATQPAPGTFDGVAPVSLGAVADLLARAAEPTAVVYFLAVESGLLRWLIEPSGRVHTDLLRFADLPLAETVTEIIRPLHEGLAATREHAARRDELLDRLSTALLGPDTAEALAGARAIVVVADGPLCYLPIDLLRSPLHADRRVVDTWPTVYLPSLTTLSLLERRRDPEVGWAAQFIGFGDPVLEPPTAGAAGFAGWLAEQRVRLSPLPGTGIEVSAIAESFGAEGRAVVGAEFTESAVRALTGRTRYVHFATHAFVDPYDPLRSGLVLSPPTGADPDTDQFLQVHEIPGLVIDAELVVCSACQTAVGEYRRGEGIVGIGQALLASGARNAVLSMWPVPDNITTTFMLAMYRELRDGATVARALRGARQRVRRRHPDPYFWAPFIAIGSVPTMGASRVVDLSGGRLGSVTSVVGVPNLTGVTSLDLSGNGLTAVPEWVADLPSLVWLDLSGNRLAELPEWIGRLHALECLNLNGNRLTRLPDAIGDLTALVELGLEDNLLDALPDTLANLSALTGLRLTGNPMPSIPDKLPEGIKLFDLNEGRSGW